VSNDSSPDPLEGHDLEMQVHQLIELHRKHRQMAQVTLALAVQCYLYQPDATALGAARLIQEAS
jgi:hypothetical protein